MSRRARNEWLAVVVLAGIALAAAVWLLWRTR
jgi:hypothetical protein